MRRLSAYSPLPNAGSNAGCISSYRNMFPGNNRFAELDGLRGLAIILVVTLHYFVFVAQPETLLMKGLVQLFQLSWSGVDLFFVLSGFLIGSVLLDARNSPSYFRTFYGRRFFRIIPLYAIWLALFAIGVYIVGDSKGPTTPEHLKFNFNTNNVPLWSYALFLQTFFMSFHNTFGSAWMGVTWSLAVEEQFYLLLPLLVRVLSRKSLTRIACGMIVVAPLLRISLQSYNNARIAAYTLLPCRTDALGCGLMVALAMGNERIWSAIRDHRKYVLAAFVVLSVGLVKWTLFDSWTMTKMIGFTWIAAFYTCLLLLVLSAPGQTLSLLFRKQSLVWMGTIAYPIYLFHSGILYLLHYFFASSPTICVVGVSLALVLLFASASWHVIESPLIKYAHAKFHYDGLQRSLPVCSSSRPVPRIASPSATSTSMTI